MAFTNKKLLGLALTTALTSVSYMAHAQQAFTGGNIISTDGDFVVSTPDINNTYGNQTGQLTVYGTPNSSIGLGETVTIGQDNTSSTLVVYAQNGSDPTRILGNLFTRLKDSSGNATSARGGNVLVKDGDGIITGANSRIDANSVILTTGDISFNAGNKVEIDGFGAGSSVILNGEITVAEGGLAAFVAPTAVNNGIIKATAGRIELAGSNTKTTIDLYGDGLLEIEVDPTNTKALLAKNGGELKAAGGVIHMTTGAAEDLVNSTVNLDGVARVSSATQTGGKIILGGDNTKLVRVSAGAKAQATSATQGGEVELAGRDVNVFSDAVVNVSATDNGNGGTINLLASNKAILNGSFRAKGGDNGGNGGTITTSGVNELSFGSGDLNVTAKAFNGGEAGTWIIDPIDLNINAKEAGIFNDTLQTGTSIDALATNDVTLNSDVVWTSGADFALTAGNDLVLNNVIHGNGNVVVTGINLVDVNADITAAMIDIVGASASLNADLDAAIITGDVATVSVESNAAQIKDGIAIAAINGDVNVAAGTYNETIELNKAVNLRGEQAGVDARGRAGVEETIINMEFGGVTVTADNATVDGFEITNGERVPGIKVENADGVTLANNKIHDIRRGTDGDGIWINTSKNATVTQNWIFDVQDDGMNVRGHSGGLDINNNLVENVNGTGIEGYRLLGTASVTDNEVSFAGRDGIRMHRADGSEVLNNVITMNGVGNGIILDNINNVTVRDNVIVSAKDGVVVNGGTGNIIDDNDINNFSDTGVSVLAATDTQVTDNFIQYSMGTGVLVEDSIGTTVGGIGNALRNRIFEVGTNGVEVSGGTDTQVIGNDIRQTGVGVLANNAASLDVNNNTINDASNGVNVAYSDDAKIIDNVITNSFTGILASDSNNVLIDDNDITNFIGYGVVGFSSDNTVITDNLIQSTVDGAIGINVFDANGTQIGGDGNTLRNRIYDVDTGVILLGDTGTVIDGNDFRRTETGLSILGSASFNSDDLVITDNTFDGGSRAMDIRNATNVLIGGFRDGNTINDFQTGVKVIGGNNVNIDDNIIRNVNYGIYADNVGQLNIEDNNLDGRYNQGGKGVAGITVANSYNAQIGGVYDGNSVEDFDTGINVSNSFSADIENNDIEQTTLDAIKVSSSRYVDVKNNEIDNSTGNGVNVSWSSDAEVNGNVIHDVSGDGIKVTNGSRAEIKDNHVHRAGGQGITVTDNSYVDIDDNEVYSAGKNGIRVEDSFDALIQKNDVRNAGDDGIDLSNSLVADIRNNYIENAGDDGIDAEDTGLFNGKGVDIVGNTINGTDEDGINVSNVSAVDVDDNTIYKAGRDGINLSESDFADIRDNNILGTNGRSSRSGTTGAGRDGIHVTDSENVDITGNDIKAGRNGSRSFGGRGAGQFGIYADDTFNVNVSDNDILGASYGNRGSGSDAIRVMNSEYADIRKNTVFNVGGDAVHVQNSAFVDVVGNQSRYTGDDGIDIENSANADVQDNSIFAAQNNGIELEYSDNATIDDENTITRTGLNGIYVEGGEGVVVDGNTVNSADENGIAVTNTIDALVTDNDVNNSDAAGVLVNGAFGTEVSENTLIGNDIGVEVRGFEDRFIDEEFEQFEGEGGFIQTAFISSKFGAPSDETLILNNVIYDSATAGIKTSGNAAGAVEITGNELDANAIGMLLEGGEIDISNLLAPNTINSGETAMRIIGGDVSLDNNSLGATIFSDQTGNYVELVDGALFNPGTPTIIDGLAASFDGVLPLRDGIQPGVLTAAQRQAIEDRIIDFDDNTTLGQIIVGLGLNLDEEDIFALNLFSLSPDAANVNVTFNGLPRVTAASLTDLANLEPAAGGNSPEDLANIEPAAGAAQGCWASVADASFEGTVNFSFGADVLSESSCSN